MDKVIENMLKEYTNRYGLKFTEKSIRYLEEHRRVTLDELKELPLVRQCSILMESGLLHEFPKQGDYVKTIAIEAYFGWTGFYSEFAGEIVGFGNKFNNGEHLRDFLLKMLEDNRYTLGEQWGA